MNQETEHKIVPAVTILAIFAFGIITFALANASEITPENIINIVNQERAANGLNPVKMNSELQDAAVAKSRDMIYRNYFDHYAFGETPWMFILRAGYNYSVAGENLAKGFSSSEGVVSAWMNSPAHRANILNPNYQEIGVGVVKGAFTENGQTTDTTLTTEMLAAPRSRFAQFFATITNALTGILVR
ncbi:MAG: CAP domain-containing protein [Candidatus Berkelbacteria bacterium]